MHRVKLNQSVNLSSGSVLTIGNFDGVHVGHQQLINAAVEQGQRLGLPVVLVTFSPYPHDYFREENAPLRLQRLSEKILTLLPFSIDEVACLRFDARLANMSAQEFVSQLFVKQFKVKHVVVGDDFRFGKARQGNAELLVNMGEQLGFSVQQVDTVMISGERVSSSRVRNELKQGNCLQVKLLLGRYYRVVSRVVYGDQRGRQWGFPTANLPLFRDQSPLQGIYAVRVEGEDFTALGVASIGFRPVFRLKKPLLEVFLLDFDRNIYGQRLCVDFVYKIRDEADFVSVDALRERIAQDVVEARAFFSENAPFNSE